MFSATGNNSLQIENDEYKNIYDQIVKFDFNSILNALRSDINMNLGLGLLNQNDFDSLLIEYKRFITLKIISSDYNEPIMLTPCKTVDEIWRSHLLHPLHYLRFCRGQAEGELINYDHTPERNETLGTIVKKKKLTAFLYRAVFGEPRVNNIWWFQKSKICLSVASGILDSIVVKDRPTCHPGPCDGSCPFDFDCPVRKQSVSPFRQEKIDHDAVPY